MSDYAKMLRDAGMTEEEITEDLQGEAAYALALADVLRNERDVLRADLAAQKERVEEYRREVERRDEYMRGADADLAAARAELEEFRRNSIAYGVNRLAGLRERCARRLESIAAEANTRGDHASYDLMRFGAAAIRALPLEESRGGGPLESDDGGDP